MSKIKEFISQQGELRDFQGEIVRMCSEHTLITRPQFQKLMAEGEIDTQRQRCSWQDVMAVC